MQASNVRLTAAHLFYAMSLCAASTALFGMLGLPVSAFILLVWWQILLGAQRESNCISESVSREQTLRVSPAATSSDRAGFTRMELLVVMMIAGILVGLLMPASSDSDPMRHAEISMKMVARAMRAYELQHGAPPPSIIYDDSGNPMHSWRALILPQLGEDKLAAAYRWDEPWNGPNNLLLAQYRPWHYRTYYPQHDDDVTSTSIHAMRGPADEDLLIVEHEQALTNWLEPTSFPASKWELFQRTPELGEGFWKPGFFVSSYRGRLAVMDDRTFQIHPPATTSPTQLGELPDESSGATPIVLGQPHVRLHIDNALRLGFFLVVALYPIRWLKRIHASSSIS